jgi:uncharacterized protein
LAPTGNKVLASLSGGWALISGAAKPEGLGYAYARQLAADGFNVVLVDLMADELQSRAAELQEQFGVEVRTVVCDLGSPGPYAALADATNDLEVDVLVCNHMYTPVDSPEVLDMPLEVHCRMLDINARGYVNLLHPYGRAMRARNRGAIVVVASGAGLTSAPYTGAYSANKAFQIALAEALWYELGDSAVEVLIMAAGLMRTQGDALDSYPQWMIAEPVDVVREALGAIGRKHLVYTGWANRLTMMVQTRLLSRRRTVLSIGSFMAKGLGK